MKTRKWKKIQKSVLRSVTFVSTLGYDRSQMNINYQKKIKALRFPKVVSRERNEDWVEAHMFAHVEGERETGHPGYGNVIC